MSWTGEDAKCEMVKLAKLPVILNYQNQAKKCIYFRKEFRLSRTITSAHLLVITEGAALIYINAHEYTGQTFNLLWTSYKKRLIEQRYEITKLLKTGENHLGIILTPGYYAGRLPFVNNWYPYGKAPGILCRLEVEYKDGTQETVDLSEDWRQSTGPIMNNSGIYDGEVYDARLEQDWLSPYFDDSDWEIVDLPSIDRKVKVVLDTSVPIRRNDTIIPQSLKQRPNGDWILDMGQNMVGWMQFKVNGPRGETIILEHGEVLDENGDLYTTNLRSAKQRIEYTLKGGGEEEYEPHFTYMGFRYVRIKNYPGTPNLDDFRGIVIHADMPRSGYFSCADTMVNRLYQNILWSQRGNYLAVPTDCPQRDERLGWTGDVQIFGRTAAYNYDVLPFLSNWLVDLRLDQNSNGNVPWTVPKILLGEGAAGWGDVAVLLPWDLYIMYGDTTILADQYLSAKKWVDHRIELAGSDFLMRDTEEFGDWLAYQPGTESNDKSGFTDHDFIATAYLAHSSHVLSKIAHILGREEDAIHYQEKFERTKKAFQEEFLSPNGRLSPHTQTAYVLALHFELIPTALADKSVAYLVQNIKYRDMHLSTGYLGTGLINEVLTKHGYSDIAYELLLQKTYPSWLYPITKGATTIWERWDGIRPDGSFGSEFMNSFNHTPLGAVGSWLYGSVAGIRPVDTLPGFKHILFAPLPHPKMPFASATFTSQYGEIGTEWKVENDSFYINLSVPSTCTATFILPQGKRTSSDTLFISSGLHTLSFPYQFDVGFDQEILFRELWGNTSIQEKLLLHFPELSAKSDRQIRRMFQFSFQVIIKQENTIFKSERVAAFEREILEAQLLD